MGTITLPNFRTTADVTMNTRLKDGGVYIDWAGLTDIKAWLYSDAQKTKAGRCVVSINQADSTKLVCEYSATKPQYLGVQRLIVQAKYMGRTKTYDKPVFNFVPRTADQNGTQIVIDDPVVDVEISVEDVSSSLIEQLVADCIKATEEAQEVVDTSRGPRGFSAYEVAVQNGFEGTEEEWLLSLQGKSAYEIAVELGYEGTEEQWIASLKGDPGTTPHIGQNGNWFIGDVDTGVAAGGQNGVTPHIGDNGHWYIGDVDTEVIAEGHDGEDGTTPHIGDNGHWFIGDTDTNVVAEGHDGEDGADGSPGITPHIGANRHWFIGDTDTNVVAEGQDGAPGQDGSDGTDGTDGITPHIGSNGNWYIGDDDTEVPATGPAGQDGSPGITAEDVEDVQDIEETLAAVALKKTAQTLTSAEKAQVWENLGLDDISGKADKILVADSVPVGGMRPNTFYNLGTLTGSVSIEFSVAPDNTIYNEWMFQFETGTTAPTITWPAAITSWLGGSAPTINAYKKYQVSVVNGLAVIGDF